MKSRYLSLLTILLIAIPLFLVMSCNNITNATAPMPPNPQNGSIGVSGTLASNPPSEAPTIVSPANNATFNSLPVNVTGWCPNNTLIKLFDNNVFSGSAQCSNSSYSISADLFSGNNQLFARAYDALDQGGPDSNIVNVVFNDTASVVAPSARINLTSNYAIKGSDPKQTLVWPIIVSGGFAPYAISVDWGDGTSNDVYSIASPGEFNIKHVYEQSGVYRMLVKGADKNNEVAYLQLTAICNGQIKKNGEVAGETANKAKLEGFMLIWLPLAITIPLMILSFFLGDRYAVMRIKKRLKKGQWLFKR